ncbi:Zn-ribbon domain-containing OB-fold protein [uncultured Sneathiella sp.]|uniref:Zn-ribbon domain-containing OB-fold protein n=1 Tax=uncultured Sneathiella sp. TaxID=879315 RepID=UPI0030EDB0EC|tara:strand:- start:21189 stop:21617 length:429 start_codon:yes stop_codon:yes gene_type:complete
MTENKSGMFIPEPSWLTQPFWDNANKGVLTRQKCKNCGFEFFPPQFACRQCLGTELTWVPSKGRGRIYSFSVLHMAPDGRPLVNPTILADVDLDEGWHMMTNIEDCPVEQLECDMEVSLKWRRLSDLINLPVFSPVNKRTAS